MINGNAVLPLSKKLGDKAREIQQELAKEWMVDYDDTGSIGKRYRREDEIGTPYCITVDFDTVGDAEKAGDRSISLEHEGMTAQTVSPAHFYEIWNQAQERPDGFMGMFF